MNGEILTRGTYVHSDLIVHIASWCSAKYAVKVCEIVKQYYLEHSQLEKNKLIEEIKNLKNKLDNSHVFGKIKKSVRVGYTYCVYSDIINGIKIGYWKSTIKTLRKRYVTCYGENLILICVKTFLPRTIEKKTHDNFRHHKIINEIFKKEYLNEYVDYINDNKITVLNNLNIDDVLAK